MFCDNCGNEIDEGSKFCDYCGEKVFTEKAKDFSVPNLNLKKYFSKKVLRWLLICLVILVIVGIIIYLYITLQHQREATLSIENQINQVKQEAETTEKQNEASKDQIITQLNSQSATAQQQAQSAQSSLALLEKSKGTPVNTNNTFPKVNTQAIVLIICADGQGNLQSGSGTIITSDGYVLTNKHVVTDETTGASLQCEAAMNDGGTSPTLNTDTLYPLTLSASNAGYFSTFDAALLKIDGAIDSKSGDPVTARTTFPYIKPSPGGLKQGDSLFIFGYPAASNLVFNASRGIVSSFANDGYINTDALIDHGNSGGAAITSDGRFIGIPSRKYTGEDGDYLGQILDISNLNLSGI